MKVSVIVPVYNGEKYLHESIDSILAQTLEDIEIIFVDDGSTDSSLSILQEYQKKDDRIRILTQKNQYCGVARNTGMTIAEGEYIIFWDCDDIFMPDALERMYEAASACHADICLCDAQDFDNETGEKLFHDYLRKPFPEEKVFSGKELGERVFLLTSAVTWNKLIRRQFYLDQKLVFQAIRTMEDASTTYLALACADRITLVKKKLIRYRTNRPNSLVYANCSDPCATFEAYGELWNRLRARGLDQNPDIVKSFRNKSMDICFYTMKFMDTEEHFQEYYREMKTIRLQELGIDRLSSDDIMGDLTRKRYEWLTQMSELGYLLEMYKYLDRRLASERQNMEKLKKDRKKNKKMLETLQQSHDALVQEKEHLQVQMLSEQEKSRMQEAADQEQLRKLQEELERALEANQILQDDNRRIQQEKQKLETSWSYRIGRILMWLPGKFNSNLV